jgi:hypothetical protein
MKHAELKYNFKHSEYKTEPYWYWTDNDFDKEFDMLVEQDLADSTMKR